MMTICSRGLSCVMFDKTLQTFRRLGRYERKSITFEPKLNLATLGISHFYRWYGLFSEERLNTHSLTYVSFN